MAINKLALGGAAAMGTATAGIGGAYLLKADDGRYIHELIKEDPTLELLTSKNVTDSDWKASWEKYRKENQSHEKDPWGIKDWKSLKSQADGNAPSDLLDRCEANSKKRVVDRRDPLYLEVVKWCVKDKRVEASSLLASDNKELLTSGTTASDSAWTTVWDTYWKDFKDTDSNPWGIGNWASLKANKGTSAPTDFISKCASEAKVLILSKEDPVYKNLSKYCTKNKQSG
ncbi:hypothetical protein HF1_12620 [Mycoplasma haemofelis str. Langford 1]|uniref:Uncharacterized protein n=1 Tax=Mycoplasma haemofelis (strain Langford 1) TaxID=941640 RepID=E8ZJE9_MYCHL|nr:hypothetical protein [Mycoplasma haemofelis]CBY93270.1 hypothetical protein HF1_12620 [Mycoplasma haemofelis str. Langford 1]